MSSNASHTLHSKQTVSGTNSPPLEATGEDKPMGQACVDDCTINAGHVSDEEQRKGACLCP
ncbi:hypothetical protein GALMADRAFT_242652 [Galerina marginata CBS 339.88]|uniref:Uncharacterized protein n=1 Tax=Galerina marginata (strain CBS 339.88) TaxID=685588 RepID=A0A067TD80_GALM3|nr:hypothetical protein GALMADRAFT_242652 [Galerina marginata CBS 339.88]